MTRLVVSGGMGFPVGAAAIVWIGGHLIAHLDWRYVFWFAGITSGLIGIIWHFVATNTPEGLILIIYKSFFLCKLSLNVEITVNISKLTFD